MEPLANAHRSGPIRSSYPNEAEAILEEMKQWGFSPGRLDYEGELLVGRLVSSFETMEQLCQFLALSQHSRGVSSLLRRFLDPEKKLQMIQCLSDMYDEDVQKTSFQFLQVLTDGLEDSRAAIAIAGMVTKGSVTVRCWAIERLTVMLILKGVKTDPSISQDRLSECDRAEAIRRYNGEVAEVMALFVPILIHQELKNSVLAFADSDLLLSQLCLAATDDQWNQTLLPLFLEKRDLPAKVVAKLCDIPRTLPYCEQLFNGLLGQDSLLADTLIAFVQRIYTVEPSYAITLWQRVCNTAQKKDQMPRFILEEMAPWQYEGVVERLSKDDLISSLRLTSRQDKKLNCIQYIATILSKRGQDVSTKEIFDATHEEINDYLGEVVIPLYRLNPSSGQQLLEYAVPKLDGIVWPSLLRLLRATAIQPSLVKDDFLLIENILSCATSDQIKILWRDLDQSILSSKKSPLLQLMGPLATNPSTQQLAVFRCAITLCCMEKLAWTVNECNAAVRFQPKRAELFVERLVATPFPNLVWVFSFLCLVHEPFLRLFLPKFFDNHLEICANAFAGFWALPESDETRPFYRLVPDAMTADQFQKVLNLKKFTHDQLATLRGGLRVIAYRNPAEIPSKELVTKLYETWCRDPDTSRCSVEEAYDLVKWLAVRFSIEKSRAFAAWFLRKRLGENWKDRMVSETPLVDIGRHPWFCAIAATDPEVCTKRLDEYLALPLPASLMAIPLVMVGMPDESLSEKLRGPLDCFGLGLVETLTKSQKAILEKAKEEKCQAMQSQIKGISELVDMLEAPGAKNSSYFESLRLVVLEATNLFSRRISRIREMMQFGLPAQPGLRDLLLKLTGPGGLDQRLRKLGLDNTTSEQHGFEDAIPESLRGLDWDARYMRGTQNYLRVQVLKEVLETYKINDALLDRLGLRFETVYAIMFHKVEDHVRLDMPSEEQAAYRKNMRFQLDRFLHDKGIHNHEQLVAFLQNFR